MTRQIPYPHPGEILAEEFLKPMEITPYRLAKEIHVPLTRIAAILAGKRAVSVDTALRLSRYFGTSEAFWSGLQTDYDTAIAKDTLATELNAIATYNDGRFALAA
ncbi:MAG: HigA family addiction module antidote protein [Polaromonas sp.]|uniref:HigA family addiction module antitoxin n=1 Tax=Polaromonas sp. TaxID=1869339 RepID=UPI0025D118BF|nr:HigA family addiction module antitoxin [Polaromonas sp.]MBI2728188.1 HigA family addiction module antidote protein [Polaromonas sp.]